MRGAHVRAARRLDPARRHRCRRRDQRRSVGAGGRSGTGVPARRRRHRGTRRPASTSGTTCGTGGCPGVGAGTRYGFRVDGRGTPSSGLRFNPDKLLLDPYARAVTGELTYDPAVFGHVGRTRLAPATTGYATTPTRHPFVPDRGRRRRPRSTGPATSRPRIRWSDTVLYELHVRGFTLRHPDVPPELRGTYAGLAHPRRARAPDLARRHHRRAACRCTTFVHEPSPRASRG